MAMELSVADKSRGGKFGIFEADFSFLAMIKAYFIHALVLIVSPNRKP